MGSRLEKGSNDVKKRIQSHTFDDEQGEEYEGSKFGGFADYMRRKKIKLQNLDSEIRSRSSQNPQIFRNIVVHVNGYTQPSLSDLHQLIVSHGGAFLQYLDGKTACTHVIASQLTPKKKVEFAKYRIVKPAWIVDSVKAGRLLPWDAYRIVDEGATQKVLGFENGQMVSQANAQQHGYRNQSDTSWYMFQMKTLPQHQPDHDQNLPNGNFRNQELSPGALRKEDTPAEGFLSPLSTEGSSEVVADAGEDDLEDSAAQEVAVAEYDESDDGELMRFPPTKNKSADGILPGASTRSPAESSEHMIDQNTKRAQKRQLTAEEHNAILLQNPHMAKSSTANPDFLNQYYRESRLHHLSTWKADLKAQLQARAQEKSSNKKPAKRAPGARRYVMHVDFDSFFAAVSLRKNPHLVDKPVVIAHGNGPGSEIASCNYPARKYGIKNGMWMQTALGLCPNIKVLPYDYKLYEEASRHFYDSILAIEGIVQSISIDEALVDVTDQCTKAGGSDGRGLSEGSIYREQAWAQKLAQDLRNAVKDKTGCDVSVGMGNNILLAKVALRKAKPAGQHLIKPEDVLDFIGELLVTDLPGVAWSIGKKLEEIGIKYVKDIRSMTKERLTNTLGPKTGEKIWDYSRGIDKQEVGEQVIRKSVSAEINWGIRFINQQQAEDFVQCLCDELSKRLLEQLVKGRQLTMKIMRKSADAGMDPPKNLGHGKCDTFNKSVVLGVATTEKSIIGKEAISMLRSYGFSPGELRGLGVQMQKLEPLKPAQSPSTSTLIDSSQRRLQFKKPPTPAHATKIEGNSALTQTPTKAKEPLTPRDRPDPIEDLTSPQKDASMQPVQGALSTSDALVRADNNQRPLNVAGTQFVLPSQIDPTVLDELPADIRSKLAPKQKTILDRLSRSSSPQLESKSRSASPQVNDGDYTLPNQSQLDPETLAELPDDVKSELLSHYAAKSTTHSKKAQQVLPQSPRKDKPANSTRRPAHTPTKKQKFSSVLTKGRSKTSSIGFSTLTQSNFVSMPKLPASNAIPTVTPDEEISQSFLDELPEDIRLEILVEQKRNRMKNKSGLNLSTKKRRAPGPAVDVPKGQQTIQLPPPPAKPTFTSQKLSSLPELRDAMTAWVDEFSEESEDGPYLEDTEALAQYLRRVVRDERDIEKAVSVVKWLALLVESKDFEVGHVQSAWHQTLHELRTRIQDAVKTRNLPPVDFE